MKNLVGDTGLGALPFGQSRPFALLSSANILGGLFLASLGAELHSSPALKSYNLNLVSVTPIKSAIMVGDTGLEPVKPLRCKRSALPAELIAL